MNDLLDPARLYRRDDLDTSREAAESIYGSITQLQAQVMRYARMRGADGFTDSELNRDLHCHGSTLRTRRAELVEAGFIVNSGRSRKYGSKGRRHTVWRAA